MIHEAFNAKSWTATEALARICLCESDQTWTDLLTDAQSIHASRAIGGDVYDPAVLGKGAKRWTEALTRDWPDGQMQGWAGVHPLVWVRWALTQAGGSTSSRLRTAVGQWYCAQSARGSLMVLKGQSEASRPSLKAFGFKSGNGWPVDLFLAAPEQQVNLSEPWEARRYSINALRGKGKDSSATTPIPATASAAAPVRRSRGRLVEFAVETALGVFFYDSNDIQRIPNSTTESRPRYQVDNITREELVKRLRKGYRSLNGYQDETIIAELSRWVKFPRGKPAHR